MEPNKLFGEGGSGIRAGETAGGTGCESVVGFEHVRTAVRVGNKRINSLEKKARLWVMGEVRPGKVGE